MDLTTFFTGLGMGLSLIVAIGAQNAFVLRQGLKGEHVFAVASTCALSDALLITIGVTSFAKASTLLPWLDPLMRYAGAAFLIWYGLRSLRSAFTATGTLEVTTSPETSSLARTLLACLAFTWLNPHVYLDTVVLLGAVSSQFAGRQFSFGLGAATASFVFFFALAYGARLLRPVFANPRAWRLLEGGIGLLMWFIAAKLLLRF